MNYIELRRVINQLSELDFSISSSKMEELIFRLTANDIMPLITEIGTIPEDIEHDSSEEKLYTKTSDILFAKALELMNFEVGVLRERADSADIIARSKYHSYSLVGDAKAFRLSRTAKNAKDFKVDAMVHWKGTNDFSVLACPYYQYPKSQSQIYKEALNGNVALFSWEYLYIMLREGIRESATLNLHDLWNQSQIISRHTTVDNMKRNFIATQDANIRNILDMSEENFVRYFQRIKEKIIERGNGEIQFYESEIERIRQMNREEAIRELLVRMKFDSKIDTIRKFINSVAK